MKEGQDCPFNVIEVFVFTVAFIIIFILILNLVSKPVRNVFLTLSCICLIVFYCALSLYYLKVGGFSRLQRTLFLTGPLPVHALETLPVSFERLAIILSHGRLLFCYFFLMESLVSYHRTRTIEKYKIILGFLFLFPVLIVLIMSYPRIFRTLFDYDYSAQAIFSYLVDFLISIYLVSASILMFLEYRETQIMYFKLRNRARLIAFVLLGFQYAMFSMFDPVTVFQNYGSIKLPNRLTYYYMRNKTGSWILFLGLFLASTLISLVQTLKYCHLDYDERKKELVIKEKINRAALSSSILIHGIKNQLLSSQVILKNLGTSQLTCFPDDVRLEINKLSQITDSLVERLSILYRSFIKIDTVFRIESSTTVFDLIRRKVGDRTFIHYEIQDVKLLCDSGLLSEALVNLITNAIEATFGRQNPCVEISLIKTRACVLISVKDNGTGISKSTSAKLFSPFFSTKNSQTNWGLGLSYSNMVVKKHRGSIQFETKEGVGTTFLVDLPNVTEG